MKAFTRLFTRLDETNRTNAKVAALEDYFREAPEADAAWALFFLMGNRLRAPVRTKQLRAWAARESGLPAWLVEESYSFVGDLAETLALLLPERAGGRDGAGVQAVTGVSAPALHELIESNVQRLGFLPDSEKFALLRDTWRRLEARERLVYNKLITGSFRVGISRTLVSRALANVAGIEPALMAHRLMGAFEPRPDRYRGLFAEPGEASADAARPYPFYLAYSIEEVAGARAHGGGGEAVFAPARLEEALGPVQGWHVEWKWDGIRAQLIRRRAQTVIWSRGEDLVTPRYPEIAGVAEHLPDGCVLDGELLAWDAAAGRPAPFSLLQTRIGRDTVNESIMRTAPAVFMAYDVLEYNAEDRRGEPLEKRRERLLEIVGGLGDAASLSPRAALAGSDRVDRQLDLFAGAHAAETDEAVARIRVSPEVAAETWTALAALRGQAREHRAEGLMVKRRGSPYRVGRVKGDWWKWKVDPLTLDAVMVYAEAGHGKRAGLFTDYTFALRDGNDALVPFAKAYSGLTDQEIAKLDNWIKRNTRERHGPVRIVEPARVFELAFEGIAPSTRHKSGLAVRFPRILRERTDKRPDEVDTLESARALMEKPGEAAGSS